METLAANTDLAPTNTSLVAVGACLAPMDTQAASTDTNPVAAGADSAPLDTDLVATGADPVARDTRAEIRSL